MLVFRDIYLYTFCIVCCLWAASCSDTVFVGSSDPIGLPLNETETTIEQDTKEEKTVEEVIEEKPAVTIEETSPLKIIKEIILEEELPEEEPSVEPEKPKEVAVAKVTPPVVVEIETEEVIEDPKPVFVSQKFLSTTNKLEHNVDLLLIVDNSVSMDHEIQQVQENLKKLVEYVSRHSSTRVGILSSFSHDYLTEDPHNILQISPETHQFVKIDQRVRSWNSLYLASLFIQDKLSYLGVKGSDFFRKDSLKAFMVVTDDDSLDFSAAEFAQVVDQVFERKNVRFYGFIGIPEQYQSQHAFHASANQKLNNCNIYNYGKIYDQLVSQYFEGALFDICSINWSDHFERVARSVALSVNSSYPLAFPASKIHEIHVSGQAIAPSNAHIKGQNIVFDPGVLPLGENVRVEIIYEKNTNF